MHASSSKNILNNNFKEAEQYAEFFDEIFDVAIGRKETMINFLVLENTISIFFIKGNPEALHLAPGRFKHIEVRQMTTT